MRCLTRGFAALLALRALCAHGRFVAAIPRPGATASPPSASRAPPPSPEAALPDAPVPLYDGAEFHAGDDHAGPTPPPSLAPFLAPRPPAQVFGAGAVLGLAAGWLGNTGWRSFQRHHALEAAQEAAKHEQWSRAWQNLRRMAHDGRYGGKFRECWDERLRLGGENFIEDNGDEDYVPPNLINSIIEYCVEKYGLPLLHDHWRFPQDRGIARPKGQISLIPHPDPDDHNRFFQTASPAAANVRRPHMRPPLELQALRSARMPGTGEWANAYNHAEEHDGTRKSLYDGLRESGWRGLVSGGMRRLAARPMASTVFGAPGIRPGSRPVVGRVR